LSIDDSRGSVDARTIESALGPATSCAATTARFFGALGSFGAALMDGLAGIGAPACTIPVELTF
jgi:hypothetical protein